MDLQELDRFSQGADMPRTSICKQYIGDCGDYLNLSGKEGEEDVVWISCPCCFSQGKGSYARRFVYTGKVLQFSDYRPTVYKEESGWGVRL